MAIHRAICTPIGQSFNDFHKRVLGIEELLRQSENTNKLILGRMKSSESALNELSHAINERISNELIFERNLGRTNKRIDGIDLNIRSILANGEIGNQENNNKNADKQVLGEVGQLSVTKQEIADMIAVSVDQAVRQVRDEMRTAIANETQSRQKLQADIAGLDKVKEDIHAGFTHTSKNIKNLDETIDSLELVLRAEIKERMEKSAEFNEMQTQFENELNSKYVHMRYRLDRLDAIVLKRKQMARGRSESPHLNGIQRDSEEESRNMNNYVIEIQKQHSEFEAELVNIKKHLLDNEAQCSALNSLVKNLKELMKTCLPAIDNRVIVLRNEIMNILKRLDENIKEVPPEHPINLKKRNNLEGILFEKVMQSLADSSFEDQSILSKELEKKSDILTPKSPSVKNDVDTSIPRKRNGYYYTKQKDTTRDRFPEEESGLTDHQYSSYSLPSQMPESFCDKSPSVKNDVDTSIHRKRNGYYYTRSKDGFPDEETEEETTENPSGSYSLASPIPGDIWTPKSPSVTNDRNTNEEL